MDLFIKFTVASARLYPQRVNRDIAASMLIEAAFMAELP